MLGIEGCKNSVPKVVHIPFLGISGGGDYNMKFFDMMLDGTKLIWRDTLNDEPFAIICALVLLLCSVWIIAYGVIIAQLLQHIFRSRKD
jgi:hypothetical protein